MKTTKLFALVILMIGTMQSNAQNYSIGWYSFDGGGGTSTGGVYSVTGSIGQPDAGASMTGGNYSLAGGFWSLFAVIQTPGAPTLRIRTGTNGVTIAWPAPSSGWVLEHTAVLGTTASWKSLDSPPVVVVGAENTVTFNPATEARYLRLRRP